jgi:hypothetical protein
MPLTHMRPHEKWSTETKKIVFGLIVSMLALTIANVFITVTTTDLNNRKWCGILSLYHDTYRDNPPTTPTGQAFRDQLEPLYRDFKCASAARPKP